MPDTTGLLTAEDRETIASWLKAKTGENHFCPVCDHDDWIVAEHLVQPMTLGANLSVRLGGPGYPQAMTICTNCGHTQFFNTVIMGLVKPAATPTPPPEVKNGD